MRAIRAASAALLGVASLALTAPLAAATDSKQTTPFFTVIPSTVSPGGRVTLSASGCNGPATATSGVFDAVTINQGTSTSTSVDADARPGAVFTVRFICTGQASGNFDITIAGGRSTPTISSTVSTSPGAVRGGLGGSIGGMNAGELAAGTALVVAAATATVYVVRRRSGSHQH
ncbi:hypothetical protein HRW23_10185 [Streptomyces lunaelactis]|uniref:hypothetical protein n=2 Tax=Streptomyces lunaelactis TaxID=1535768 RepID=UPI001584ED44|nr:hypothetical protein [Streptomyces lunaelactis]NUJ99557.1 hypothetical protein [Streptomyces lunaelactis]NUK14281.1 hypothetical protein [Streptomyces lunaelactis]NUK21155.1 hypothetical protein [Streptomyces lunaelactis]NUK32902.1 hypothetical protein [Streptomyces lunaelactis]NUK40276.1 hypothetical protein [Streptomyces lunaelactis]